MKKRYFLRVQGREHTWSFPVELEPHLINEPVADGVQIEGEIFNTVPGFMAGWRLARAWCFVQDVFNFRNPFA
jgi:hypothetical protein